MMIDMWRFGYMWLVGYTAMTMKWLRLLRCGVGWRDLVVGGWCGRGRTDRVDGRWDGVRWGEVYVRLGEGDGRGINVLWL